MGLYDFAWDRWYRKAKKRAMRDPEYAAEELGRSCDNFFVGSGKGSDGKEYTLEGMWKHHERFDKINPRPWWVKIHHWRDKHRLRFRLKWNDSKWFIQRGRRGYADCDLWSFDTYLAKIISTGTAELRDIAHGYPGDMCEVCCGPYVEHDCNGFEKWQNILTEMSEGFSEDKFTREFDEEKFNHAMSLFVKYFHNLWD